MQRSMVSTGFGKGLLGGVLLAVAMVASGHRVLDREEMFEAFGWDPDTTEITTEEVAPGRHVLFGLGGNVLASIGEQGVLLVDDQIPELREKIDAALAELGAEHVDFVINTHWHFDHADGNLSYGPDGVWLISQANSRQMMTEDRVINLVGVAYEQKAYPPEALPVITFDDRMQLHFNGERIDLIHAGPAHTTGDAAVIFRGHNIAHIGDLFVTTGWPFIDVGSGGDLDGLIAFCRRILEEIDADTIVVPGHGDIADRAALERYVENVAEARSRISELMDEGLTLEEIIAAEPTADLDAEMGDSAMFLDRAWHSLRDRGRTSATH